jgi:hypothetical protein
MTLPLDYLQRSRPKLENEKDKWVFVGFEIGDPKTCISNGLWIQHISSLFLCARKLWLLLAHVQEARGVLQVAAPGAVFRSRSRPWCPAPDAVGPATARSSAAMRAGRARSTGGGGRARGRRHCSREDAGGRRGSVESE